MVETLHLIDKSNYIEFQKSGGEKKDASEFFNCSHPAASCFQLMTGLIADTLMPSSLHSWLRVNDKCRTDLLQIFPAAFNWIEVIFWLHSCVGTKFKNNYFTDCLLLERNILPLMSQNGVFISEEKTTLCILYHRCPNLIRSRTTIRTTARST